MIQVEYPTEFVPPPIDFEDADEPTPICPASGGTIRSPQDMAFVLAGSFSSGARDFARTMREQAVDTLDTVQGNFWSEVLRILDPASDQVSFRD